MKFPSRVKVGGMVYEIRVVNEPIIVNHSTCYGYVDYSHGVIKLAGNDVQGDQHRYVAFWHEVLHALIQDRGIELEDEEKVVIELGQAMAAFCMDNQLIFREVEADGGTDAERVSAGSEEGYEDDAQGQRP